MPLHRSHFHARVVVPNTYMPAPSGRLICLFTLLTLVACAGSSSLSYSHLMTASWLLRSSQGRPIIALPYIRLMRARVAAGQASLPSMQVD